MPLSPDAKFGIGILVATVLIIAGGAWYASQSSPVGSQSQDSTPVDQGLLVREDSPVRGAQDAQVTVVEFGDFECPACGALHPALQQIKEKYKDQPVRFVYRQYPLPQHPNAALSAEASLAAHAQGKFWELHDLMFENQTNLEREDIQGYAQQLGLNMDQFNNALDDHTYEDQVEHDIRDGRAAGVQGTPTLFINGIRYTQAYSIDGLSAQIDQALNTGENPDQQ